MTSDRRTSVSFSPKVYRALKAKAATSGRTPSELVSDTVRLTIGEDEIDCKALRRRAKEPSRAYADVLRDLRHRLDFGPTSNALRDQKLAFVNLKFGRP